MHPNRKISSTFNSSKSAEVQNKEQSTFMNQVHISQQNSLPANALYKRKTMPADSAHFKSLLSRHDDLDCESEKAREYDDVGGVLILRTRLRITEEAQEIDEPRRRTL